MKNLNDLIMDTVNKMLFNDMKLIYKYKIEIRIGGIVKESRIIDSMPSDAKMKEIMAGAMREFPDSKIVLAVDEIKVKIDRNVKHIRHGYK